MTKLALSDYKLELEMSTVNAKCRKTVSRCKNRLAPPQWKIQQNYSNRHRTDIYPSV